MVPAQQRTAKSGRPTTFTVPASALIALAASAEITVDIHGAQPGWRTPQDTANEAIAGQPCIRCPKAATLEAGAASTAPNDLGNRVQRSGAGRWARNHLGDHLHERGGGRQRRQGGMGAHDDDCSGG